MSLDDDTRRHVALMAGITAILGGYAATIACASWFEKVPQHTSILSRQQWVDELCEGHAGRFKNELGMSKHVFEKLLELLKKDGGLKDTSVEEQLAIFLHFAH